MKSFVRYVAVFVMLCCLQGQVHASGFPTVDAAALTQRLLEFTQMLRDYENLVSQLKQLENIDSQFRNAVSFKSFFDSLVAQVRSLPLPHEKLDEIWGKATTAQGRASIAGLDNSSQYQGLQLLRSCKLSEASEELTSLCYEKVGLYYTQREETRLDLDRLKQASDRVYELVAAAKQGRNIADVNEALYAINCSEVLLRLVRQRIEVRQYEYEVRLAANQARWQACLAEMTRAPQSNALQAAGRLGR